MLVGRILARVQERKARRQSWQRVLNDPFFWITAAIATALVALIVGVSLARVTS